MGGAAGADVVGELMQDGPTVGEEDVEGAGLPAEDGAEAAGAEVQFDAAGGVLPIGSHHRVRGRWASRQGRRPDRCGQCRHRRRLGPESN